MSARPPSSVRPPRNQMQTRSSTVHTAENASDGSTAANGARIWARTGGYQ